MFHFFECSHTTTIGSRGLIIITLLKLLIPLFFQSNGLADVRFVTGRRFIYRNLFVIIIIIIIVVVVVIIDFVHHFGSSIIIIIIIIIMWIIFRLGYGRIWGQVGMVDNIHGGCRIFHRFIINRHPHYFNLLFTRVVQRLYPRVLERYNDRTNLDRRRHRFKWREIEKKGKMVGVCSLQIEWM